MKNLTVIFFSIAVFLNLFVGFGMSARDNLRNTAVETQNYPFNSLKGEISENPLQEYLSFPQSPKRDFSSGLGKKPKCDGFLQNPSPFAVFWKSDFEIFVPIYPRKSAPNPLMSEFSSTSFLI